MKEFYISQIKQGWTLPEIDDCDYWYFLEIMAYTEKGDEHFIDELF